MSVVLSLLWFICVCCVANCAASCPPYAFCECHVRVGCFSTPGTEMSPVVSILKPILYLDSNIKHACGFVLSQVVSHCQEVSTAPNKVQPTQLQAALLLHINGELFVVRPMVPQPTNFHPLETSVLLSPNNRIIIPRSACAIVPRSFSHQVTLTVQGRKRKARWKNNSALSSIAMCPFDFPLRPFPHLVPSTNLRPLMQPPATHLTGTEW